MKSDLSRDTFDGAKHFTRVLMQQGRVTLDADHNEQVAILLHYLWTLAADVIGPAGGPVGGGGGFHLGAPPDATSSFSIGKGRYYVDGLLVENDQDGFYAQQADFPLPADDPFQPNAPRPKGPLVAYLDVWERHVTPVEDAVIREVALGGPDTCNRAKLVWQVKLAPVPQARSAGRKATDLERRKTRTERALAKESDEEARSKLQKELDAINAEIAKASGASGPAGADRAPADCTSALEGIDRIGTGRLAARLDPGALPPDPCVMPPDSRYRGAENQLYRVEVHQPGTVGVATFKWSRDNGSIATALLNLDGNDLAVARSRGFEAGNWVELTDETLDLQGKPGTLVKLAKVEPGVLTVDPASASDAGAFWGARGALPKVRRWDQVATGDITLVAGAVRIVGPTPAGIIQWIDLEDGIQVRFTADGTYRTGDYWLIPARVATGTIEWPAPTPAPDQSEQAPHGVLHHHAPLGIVAWDPASNAWTVDDTCRCDFTPLCGQLRPQ